MALSLKGRFLIPTVALIVVGMGFSALVGGTMAKRYLAESIKAQLDLVVDLTDQRIADFIKDRKIEVRRWSRLDIFRSALLDAQSDGKSITSASAQLEAIQKEAGHFDRFSIVAPSGDVIASSTPSGVGVKLGDRKYIQEALKGNLSVSDVIVSRVS